MRWGSAAPPTRRRDDPQRPAHPRAKVNGETELAVVVQAVMGATQRHDAVRVVTAAGASWDDVRRIDWRALTDDAAEPSNLLSLRVRSRHQRRRHHGASSQRSARRLLRCS